VLLWYAAPKTSKAHKRASAGVAGTCLQKYIKRAHAAAMPPYKVQVPIRKDKQPDQRYKYGVATTREGRIDLRFTRSNWKPVDVRKKHLAPPPVSPAQPPQSAQQQ
jgi:hypothetical protein